MPLTTAEKVELAAVPAGTALAAWFAPRPSLNLELGELVAGVALLILLQGFVRDLWLLREARRKPTKSTGREAQCMCVESALGLTGIVAGIGLVGFGLAGRIQLAAGELAAGVAVTMLAGFLLKDFVFEWSPWRIYREKNHASLLFRWKRQP